MDNLISIIMIGRNESKNIINAFKSTLPIMKRTTVETIYVDSASSDNSVELAQQYFDKVMVIEQNKNLCASAGRYVGCLQATGKWLLFIDADMTICANFFNVILNHIDEEEESIGLIGNYIHNYSNKHQTKWHIPHDENYLALYHGGAVLLSKKALMSEIWNPCLYSNEEIDLYTRLRNKGFHVKYVNSDFIIHNTESVSKVKIFLGIFIKNNFLGKKYYGFGQLIISRLLQRNFFSLVRWYPEPFVYNLTLMTAVLFGIFLNIYFFIVFALISAIYIHKKKGIKYAVIYLAFIPQTIIGIFKYDRNWVPKIKMLAKKNQ